MRINAFAAALIISLAAGGTVFAGPADNARQFQEKAVRSSVRGAPDITSKSRGVIINTTSSPAIRMPSNAVKVDTKQAYKDKTVEAGSAKISKPVTLDK